MDSTWRGVLGYVHRPKWRRHSCVVVGFDLADPAKCLEYEDDEGYGEAFNHGFGVMSAERLLEHEALGRRLREIYTYAGGVS